MNNETMMLRAIENFSRSASLKSRQSQSVDGPKNQGVQKQIIPE